MSITLFRSHQEAMPPWHQQPLHLTAAAMQNPYAVLDAFFDCYNLHDIRFCLREWLGEAMRTDEVLLMDFLSLHDNLLQLTEAAWLIKQQRQKNKEAGQKVKIRKVKGLRQNY